MNTIRAPVIFGPLIARPTSQIECGDQFLSDSAKLFCSQALTFRETIEAQKLKTKRLTVKFLAR